MAQDWKILQKQISALEKTIAELRQLGLRTSDLDARLTVLRERQKEAAVQK